jgi:hypothetical protein
VHVAAATSQDAQLAFNIAGEGVLQQDDSTQQSAGGQAGAGTQAQDERPGGGMGIPNERPNPLSQGQWAFLGVLTLFLGGGAAFIYMTTPAAPAAAAASPHHQSTALLEALKEEMFQLEADRLQGKLNPQEYQGAKAALDKTLQRAMKRGK